jgi:hypothetical protein
MKVKAIEQDFRLDLFVIKEYGVYSEYWKSVLCYFNPKVDLLNLKAGTKLLVPSRDEVSKLTKIRGYYDFVRT